MDNAIITKTKEIRCPICNRKISELKGNEVIKNLVIQCPKKICGVPHTFMINYCGSESDSE